jgi:hypothetical protein
MAAIVDFPHCREQFRINRFASASSSSLCRSSGSNPSRSRAKESVEHAFLRATSTLVSTLFLFAGLLYVTPEPYTRPTVFRAVSPAGDKNFQLSFIENKRFMREPDLFRQSVTVIYGRRFFMPSDKQIAASRANGAKSRGPVTPAGKQRSSRGSVETMLARAVVLDGESRERFHALLISIRDELQPQTAIENLLTHKMAIAHWRLMRVWGMEKAGIAASGDSCNADPAARDRQALGKSGAHLNEYEMRFDRQFTRALDRFERFRAARTRQLQQTRTPEVNS